MDTENGKVLELLFGGEATGPPGPPVASVLIRFHRFGCFRKPVFCRVSRVSQTLELDSGSSARKGVEVQVLSSALLFSGFLAIAGSPVFLCPRVVRSLEGPLSRNKVIRFLGPVWHASTCVAVAWNLVRLGSVCSNFGHRA